MTSRIFLPLAALLFVAPTPSFAADHRGFCKKFYPGTRLEDCIYKQEAAMKRLNSGVYDKFVVETCKDTAKRVDRVAYYTDFIEADFCAKNEQRRLDEQEQLRAEAARDRAAARYYNEAADNRNRKHYRYYKKDYRQQRPSSVYQMPPRPGKTYTFDQMQQMQRK